MTGAGPDTRGAALTTREIKARAALPLDHPQRLTLLPFDPELVQVTAVDVRLGCRFKTPRRSGGVVDASCAPPEDRYESIHVPQGDTIRLHPGEFMLAATLEFIATPRDVVTFVEGKSRLGRLGLIVATATQVAPGFHGCVVLELANLGAFTLEMRPGMPIAQLVFITTISPAAAYGADRHREYDCQIGP
jgi:dCTP deaminase